MVRRLARVVVMSALLFVVMVVLACLFVVMVVMLACLFVMRLALVVMMLVCVMRLVVMAIRVVVVNDMEVSAGEAMGAEGTLELESDVQPAFLQVTLNGNRVCPQIKEGGQYHVTCCP